MSYFEPSRRPFARQRLASWTGLLAWLWGQPRWQRPLFALLLALYVAAASSLCGAGLAPSLAAGAVIALLLACLLSIEHRAPPFAARVAHRLAAWLGSASLLLPAIVFVALGLWLLVSLPLWLYRS